MHWLKQRLGRAVWLLPLLVVCALSFLLFADTPVQATEKPETVTDETLAFPDTQEPVRAGGKKRRNKGKRNKRRGRKKDKRHKGEQARAE